MAYVSNYGRHWRKDAGKRGLEFVSEQVLTCVHRCSRVSGLCLTGTCSLFHFHLDENGL